MAMALRSGLVKILATFVAVAAAACSQPSATQRFIPNALPQIAPHTAPAWIPTTGESYQIQYGGKPDFSVPADVYDVDMFGTTPAQVAKLHAMGRRVVCYVDVGTWENWRPDAKEFPKSVLGKPDGGWPGERWLDIRQTSILEPIMEKRFQECKRKGFDGMDPDNLDGYQNKTGFPLTYAEQLAYDVWVAQAAHQLGLTVAQKGDNNQVKDLVNYFDYAVVEQCYVQGWCNQFTLYTNRNRLVVDVEYGLTQKRFLSKTCPSDAQYHETAILKRLALTAWIVTCPVTDPPPTNPAR
jgi:hypothetical protein